jgi:hypothetical protein
MRVERYQDGKPVSWDIGESGALTFFFGPPPDIH